MQGTSPINQTGSVDETPLVLLLRRMHRGDEDAATRLWREISPRLIAYAKVVRPLSPTEDAEDLVQKVFCKVLSMRSTKISEVHDVVAFFVVAVRNAATDSRRSEHRKRSFLASVVGRFFGDDINQQAASSANRDQLHPENRDEDKAELLSALGKLDAELRDVVLLKHAAALTFDQVSLALQEPRSTVAAKYQRAMEMLRRQLSTDQQPAAIAESSLVERVATRRQARVSSEAGGATCQ